MKLEKFDYDKFYDHIYNAAARNNESCAGRVIFETPYTECEVVILDPEDYWAVRAGIEPDTEPYVVIGSLTRVAEILKRCFDPDNAVDPFKPLDQSPK